MSDLKQVVPITDFKVSVKHHCNNSTMVLNTPYFSEINNYYSSKKKIGIAVKKHHTLGTLLERLNNIKHKEDKSNSIAILKGLYKDGTSGNFCYKGSPFLFFDIDVKNTPSKKENAHLKDAQQNSEVFELLNKIAVIVWRSNSGYGIAGVLYVPQLANILNNNRVKHLSIGKAISEYLKQTLNVNADFDNAQNKFRQVRYFAMQEKPRKLNTSPYVFTYDIKEVVKVSNTGVKQYRFKDNRAVFGSIQDQFNNSTTIQSALLDNGLNQLNNDRWKHPSTTSRSTGITKGNVFLNHSNSFSQYEVFTSFWLYYTQNYNYDYNGFLSDLNKKGYKEVQPQQKAFKQAEKTLKQKENDRDKQIFTACYDLVNANYKDKVKFADDNANNEAEKIKFYDYLKIKPLTITYDSTLLIKSYVSEQLKAILDYSYTHKKIIVTAETGTGKTTAFLKDFTKYRPTQRLLILAPLTAIVEQNKAEYNNIISLTANSKPIEHTHAKTGVIVMATYEQGYKHLVNGNKFDYVIIDEVHNLVTANSFKSETISNLTSILHRFNVIGLTGTTNPLFKSIGYKLVNVKKENLKPVNVCLRIDNRLPIKIALQHLKTAKGKCLIRLNSRNDAKALLIELVRIKHYKKSEILVLNSDKTVKDGKDFKQLSHKSNFRDNIKLVITTSVIDEGLSIKQSGFTDIVFIENQYKPMPEAVKQFFARFRNEDTERKNYFYFRETKNQSLNSWNPYYAFNLTKDQLIKDAKNRNVNESKSKDIANNDYLFYSNGYVNDYALAYDVSYKLFKLATTLEYITYLEINYNLKLENNETHEREKIDTTAIKEDREKTKIAIANNWLKNKDEVLNVLYRLTDNRDIKKSIDFEGLNPVDAVYDLVFTNVKEFERLHSKSIILENLGTINIDSELINCETMKPISSKIVNSKIRLLQNLDTINNPKTATDIKNKNKLLNFVGEVSRLHIFNSSDLIRLWKQQRTTSVKFNSDNLRQLVLFYHNYKENKKLKKWIKI